MTSPAIDPSLGFIDVDLLKTPTQRPTESQEATKTTDQEKKPKKDDEKAKKPPNWRIEEDQSLCTSWINTSKDATVGTDQTKMAFWD
jgi:hypothetical protein